MKSVALVEWTTLDALKGFSGTATYRTTFDADDVRRAILSVGDLPSGTARVIVNGTDCGVAWCFPFEVDVTQAVRKGKNRLEIRYSNNWHNRLTMDASLSEEKRVTKSMFRHSERPRTGQGLWSLRPTVWSGPAAGDPFQPSGVLGPVALRLQKP